jgi:hypothetical protein
VFRVHQDSSVSLQGDRLYGPETRQRAMVFGSEQERMPKGETPAKILPNITAWPRQYWDREVGVRFSNNWKGSGIRSLLPSSTSTRPSRPNRVAALRDPRQAATRPIMYAGMDIPTTECHRFLLGDSTLILRRSTTHIIITQHIAPQEIILLRKPQK